MRVKPVLLALALLWALPLPAFAQNAADHASHHAAAASQSAPTLTQGEVRNVDKAGGNVTLKHGPIANLGMPPMTMMFPVSDRKLLDQVKAGDKVKFAVEEVRGVPTVTRIERGG